METAVRAAGVLDVPALADLYMAAFPNHTRTLLGRTVCEAYFQAALASEAYYILLATTDAPADRGRSAGFVVLHIDRVVHLGRGWMYQHPLPLLLFGIRHPRFVIGSLLRRLLHRFGCRRQSAGHRANQASRLPDPNLACACVDVLAVDPSLRERGIGREILHACADASRGRGLKGVTLSVETENNAAIRLYERYGFRRIAHFAHTGSYFYRLDFDPCGSSAAAANVSDACSFPRGSMSSS